jgi:butyryl-CoA dehydrogenase
LDVALAALRDDATQSIAQTLGRTRAAAYFYHYELPKIGAWLQVVSTRDPLCATMPDAAF